MSNVRSPAWGRVRGHLRRWMPSVAQVLDQNTWRALHGEAGPANEKLLSLFEPRAAVLVKDRSATC